MEFLIFLIVLSSKRCVRCPFQVESCGSFHLFIYDCIRNRYSCHKRSPRRSRRYQVRSNHICFKIPSKSGISVRNCASIKYLHFSKVLPFMAPTAEFKKLPMLIGHGSFLAFFLDSFSKLDSSKMDSIQYFY